MKSLAVAVAVATLMSGCATQKLDSSQLSVYEDNRVGFTLQSGSSSSSSRVWSTDKTILALRFGNRLINARDILTLTAQRTNKQKVPLHIAVELKSGEALKADVVDWGNSAFSDVMVDWMACDANRNCEYLDRNPSLRGMVSFKSAGNFLTSIDESHLEGSIRPGASSIERNFNYRTDDALPWSTRTFVRMNFADVRTITDFRPALEAARERAAKLRQCVAREAAKAEREWKLTEEKIIRETPPADVPQRLSLYRASQKTGFAQTLQLEMLCKQLD